MPALAHALRTAIDLLFPARCIVCGRGDDFLCDRCTAAMKHADPPDSPDGWRGGPPGHAGDPWPLFWYEGTARKAVLALKFRGYWAGAEAMGELMAELAVHEQFAFDAVVPVPLHNRRRRQRGYNQAELLAKPVAAALGIPVRTDLLTRPRSTRHQSLITAASVRAGNVADAFAAAEGVAAMRVLLIDDVATTGATLRSCAAALHGAGAAGIAGLVFARER